MFICRQLGQDRRWIDRMRRGLPLLVTGGGRIVDAPLSCRRCRYRVTPHLWTGACCLGQTYIVTSPHAMTWQEYHERVGAALGYDVTLVDAPAELLLKVWPQNTGLLAWETQWPHVYYLGKIRRDIPEFRPQITLEEGIAPCIAWMGANGLIEDALSTGQRTASSPPSMSCGVCAAPGEMASVPWRRTARMSDSTLVGQAERINAGWKLGDAITYVRSDIPDFTLPEYTGQRYAAMVPTHWISRTGRLGHQCPHAPLTLRQTMSSISRWTCDAIRRSCRLATATSVGSSSWNRCR